MTDGNEKRKRINFAAAVQKGFLPYDIYLAEKNNPEYELYMPSEDEFMQSKYANGYKSEDDARKFYMYTASMKGLYDKRIFDTNTNFDYNTGSKHDVEGNLKWFPKDRTFFEKGPYNIVNIPGAKTPLKIEHEDQIAMNNGYIIDKNGLYVPKRKFDATMGTNPLVTEWHEDQRTFIARELQDGEIANPANIIPSPIVGGARDVSGSAVGSIYRGAVAGTVSKTISTYASLLRMANSVAGMTMSFQDGVTYESFIADNALDRYANEVSNTAASLSARQWDETGDIFANLHSSLFNISEGVAQSLPTFVFGYASGLLNLGSQLAIASGTFAVYDLTRNNLLQMGYSMKEADIMALGATVIEHASENVFQSNMMARFGISKAKQLKKRISMQSMWESFGEMEKRGAKKGLAKGAFKEMPTELGDIDVPTRSLFNNKFTRNLHKNYVKALESGTPMGKAIRFGAATFEEGAEEEIAGQGNRILNIMFNTIQKEQASEVLRRYKDITISDKIGENGLYDVLDASDNVVDTVDAREKSRINNDIALAEGIANESLLLDEDVNHDEAVIGAISGGLGAGITNMFIKQRNLSTDKETVAIARVIQKNPKKLKQLQGNIKKMFKRGLITEPMMNHLLTSYVEDVLLYADKINRYGLSDNELTAIVGDDSLFYELLKAHEAKENLTKAQKLIDKDKLTDDEVKTLESLLADFKNLNKSSSTEELQKSIDDENLLIKGLSEKKKNINEDFIKVKTSQRFTEKMNNRFAVDMLIKAKARANVIKRLKKKNAWQEGDPVPLEMIADEEAALIKKKKGFIVKGLSNSNNNSIWRALSKVVEEGAPIEEEELNKLVTTFRDSFGELFTKQQKDFEEIRQLFDDEYMLSEETTEETDKETGKKTGKQVTLHSQFKGNLLETLEEVRRRSEVAIETNGNNRVKEHVDGKLKDAIKRIGSLYENTSNLSHTSKISKEMNELFMANRDLLTRTTSLEKSLSKLQLEGDDEMGLPRSMPGADVYAQTSLDRDVIVDLFKTAEELDNDLMSDIDVIKHVLNKTIEGLKSVMPPKFISEFEDFINSNNFTPTAYALFMTMMNERTGKNQLSLFDIVSEVAKTLNDSTIPVENKTETKRKILAAKKSIENFQTLVELLYDMSVEHILLNPENDSEHSIFAPDKNEKYKPEKSHAKSFKDMLSALAQDMEEYNKDIRLSETSLKLESTKIKLGNMGKNIHVYWSMLQDNELLGNKMGDKLSAKVESKLKKISKIIKNTVAEKNPDVNKLSDDDISTELMFDVFFMAKKDEDTGEFEDQDKVERAAVKIENLLIDIEELIGGQSFIQDIIDFIKNTHFQPSMSRSSSFLSKELIYDHSTKEYEGQMSKKKFDRGRNLLRKYQEAVLAAKQNNQTVPNVSSFTNNDIEAVNDIDTYRYLYFQQLVVAQRLGKKGAKSRRQLLSAALTYLKHNPLTNIDVFTYEQLNVIVDVMAFMNSDNTKDWDSRDKDSMFGIDNSLMIRGFAGSGKSTLVSRSAILFQAMLEDKPINIVYVVLTEELEELHKGQVDGFNSILESIGVKGRINPTFIYAHEASLSNIKHQDSFSKADYIVYEEASTLEAKFNGVKKTKSGNVRPMVTGFEIDNIQKKYKSKIIFLGDEAQVRHLQNGLAYPVVRHVGEQTLPLTQIFRTGVLVIRALQDVYRNYLNYSTSLEMPKVEWQKTSDGLVGARYIDSGSNKKSAETIIENFLREVKNNPEKSIFLIVPTYENKDELLKLYGEELKNVSGRIKTMEYDASKIVEDELLGDDAKGYFKYNASGLNADYVFMPFSHETIVDEVSPSLMSPMPHHCRLKSKTIC